MHENKPLSRFRIVAHGPAAPAFTTKQKLVAVVSGVLLFVMFGAVATVQERETPVTPEWVVQPVDLTSSSLADSSDALYWYEDSYSRGDTFADLLLRLQIRHAEAARLVGDRTVERLLRKLRPGTAVQAEVTRFGDLHSLQFVTDNDTLGTVGFVDGHFSASEKPLALTHEVVSRSAVIHGNVFAATDDAGMPDKIAMQLPEVFGGEFDFNNDLRRGDRVTAVYELLYHDGKLVRAGRLLAAEVIHDREVHRAVWFDNGEVHGYFTPEGRDLRTAFLRSPLEFSRITSGFAMRLDPFSHQWTSHRGIDFAAPTGSHVRATGDGTVEFAGVQNGYGNVIILRHSSTYSTVYAHLNGFAHGLKVGERVTQAQVIGYVGQTGWATGPHLHYEFRVHGSFVNPFTVALPAPVRLDGRQLVQLRAQCSPLVARLDILKETAVAYAD